MGEDGTHDHQPADVWRMLDEGRSSLALIVGKAAEPFAVSLTSARGLDIARVGSLLTVEGNEEWREPERALRDCRILTNLDVIFASEILINPMLLLTRLSRRHSIVAVWPGEISDGVASYSEPGRRDHYESRVPGEALVVRMKTTTFPDQATFEVERIR